jgi:hypothetical protein
MLARALNLANKKEHSSSDLEAVFVEDDALIGDWARESVAIAAGSGMMKGRAAGTFAPDAATTRAEAAVVLKRLLQTAELMNK